MGRLAQTANVLLRGSFRPRNFDDPHILISFGGGLRSKFLREVITTAPTVQAIALGRPNLLCKALGRGGNSGRSVVGVLLPLLKGVSADAFIPIGDSDE